MQLWNPGSSIRQQWEIPEFRSWYENVAGERLLVLYDNRGSGLSQRDVTDFSIFSHMTVVPCGICRSLERSSTVGEVARTVQYVKEVHNWGVISKFWGYQSISRLGGTAKSVVDALFVSRISGVP